MFSNRRQPVWCIFDDLTGPLKVRDEEPSIGRRRDAYRGVQPFKDSPEWMCGSGPQYLDFAHKAYIKVPRSVERFSATRIDTGFSADRRARGELQVLLLSLPAWVSLDRNEYVLR